MYIFKSAPFDQYKILFCLFVCFFVCFFVVVFHTGSPRQSVAMFDVIGMATDWCALLRMYQ